jgi:hypothetical protein
MRTFTKSFKAKDSSGAEVRINMFTQQIRTDPLNGIATTLPGLKSLELEDGTKVNRRAKGVYETTGGRRLTSDDPDAP